MIDLLTAIQTHFNSTTVFDTDFPNGCYLSMAPIEDGTGTSPLPNCVLTVIPGRCNYSTKGDGGEDNYVEYTDIQFSVRATTDIVALGAIADICEHFDRATLVMNDDICLDCRRTSAPGVIKEDDIVWHAFAVFRFTVERAI